MTTKSAKTNGMTTKSAFHADFNRQDVITTLNNAFGKGNGMTPLPLDIDDAANSRKDADAANIEKALHIGDYPNRIAVYDIILKPNCHIARARVGIKNLVTQLMANYSYAILLFHYADAAKKEWRISWVTKGGSSSQTNAAKRYTFLCGKMHLARTIVDRLSKISESNLSSLPDKITEAFSVETLSDEFFKEYKAFYEDIVQYICGARYVKGKGKDNNKYVRTQIEDEAIIAKRGLFAKFVEQAIKEKPELSKPIDATKTQEEQKKAKETQEKKQIEDAEKLVRNYVKKLLGRLVFIQFLAKKGWMGLKTTDAWGAGNEHFLHSIYDDYQKNSGNGNFVGDVLNKVLFYSLNNTTGMDGNVAICSNNIAGTNYKFPYLNGGLFEETDLDKLDITIPGCFFVSDNREYANDDAKAPKNTTRKFIETAKKKSKKKNGEESANGDPYPYSASEGLFEFFERYNFTIDENGSDEAVVGIDPEMLGKIFENLLEDNKDKGAFYTPKPVVEYMCQQSLIAYLQNGVLNGVQTGVLNSVQNGSLQNGVQNHSVGSTALQNGVLKGVQNEVKNALQNGALQTTSQATNETSTTNTPSDELQKANLAFIKNSLTDDEIKSQIEHFVKTKSLEIENSVESRQGLGEVGIKSGSESWPEKDNEGAKSASKKDNEGAKSGSENGSAVTTTENKPQMSIEMVSLLNHLLKEVKICDPAIGSGAFPMGLLNELLECREVLALRLIDNSKWNAVFDDWGAKPTDEQLEHLRARLKKEIIQNNIYGVDIEEGAIEIARLRFWLSLVIDLDTPEPLPNFDYKFMQGNSLLESTMLPGTKKPFNLNIQEMMKEKILFPHLKTALKQLYSELRHFYGETDHIKKQNARKAIKEHVIEVLNACVDYDPTKMQAISDIAAKTKDDFTCTDFFLWHTWFADVLGLDIDEESSMGSKKGGFDIVIGNPPYIGLGGDLNKIYSPYKYVEPKQNAKKKSTVTAVDAVYKFKTHDGNGDIYCLFYEWGRELLKENGHLCYITSNKWMRAGYGEALRDMLAKETNPMILIDFGGVKVFENATVDVNILLVEKTDKNKGQTWCTDGGSDKEVIDAYKIAKGLSPDVKDVRITEKIHYFLTDYMYRGATVLPFNNSKAWVISSSSVFEQIKSKIEHVGIPLGDKRWNIRINYGIKTGCNDAFIIDTAKRNEILNSCKTADERKRTDALIRPILRGRDIKRYGYNWADKWVIATVPSRHYDIDQYPAVKEYLLSFGKERLEQTGETHHINGQKIKSRKKTSNDWFETQDPIAYLNDFDLPKIVWNVIGTTKEFTIVDGGLYLQNSFHFIVGNHLDYICAILNSKLMQWMLSYIVGSAVGGNACNADNVTNLPIAKYDSNSQPIADLANNILFAKKQNPTTDTSNYERQIDALVYELYGITSYDELLEIEGNPASALQMLILMHIHQHPNSTQTSIQTAYPTIPQSDIQSAISALVSEKEVLQNPTLSWA